MSCIKSVYIEKKGAGSLVSSQERGALAVSVINRLQIGCHPLILFSHTIYIPEHALREKGLQGQQGAVH